MSLTECPYCKKQMPYDPGSFYHKKQCQVEDILRKIKEAVDRDDVMAIRSLQAELELVSFTGD